MKRLQSSNIGDADGAGQDHMFFFPREVQNGPLHEKLNINSNSNEARRSANSHPMHKGPPPPSAIKIKRKPLGNVMNDDKIRSIDASNSPNRSSKADKWVKVINEAYDKNGLDSPLRSSSKTRRSNEDRELFGSQAMDSIESHAKERKSFGGGKNIVDSFNLYPVEGVERSDYQKDRDGLRKSLCSTPSPSPHSESSTTREIQTPAYFEFDPDVTQHIRKTKLSRKSQAGLFSVVSQEMGSNRSQNDDHFSATSSDNTSDGSDGIDNMEVKRHVDASSSLLLNAAIHDSEGSNFVPWEKASVDNDQFSDQAVNEIHKKNHRMSPRLNYRKSLRLPGSGSTIGSASSNSTSTSAWVRRLPPHTPSPSSLQHTQLEAITSTDSASTTCTNVTDEVEECTADVLHQDMASDALMKSAKKINRLPPSNGSKSPYFEQHRSNKYESNRGRRDTNRFADKSVEMSNATSRNSTQEIEECIADIMEQSVANDSTMMRNRLSSDRPPAIRADALHQDMASDALMKSAKKINRLPPSNGSKSPYFEQHRSNKYESNRGRRNAIRFADNSVEMSNATSRNSTQEIEECIADIMEQSVANDSTMMRNRLSSDRPPATHEYGNTSVEIAECIADANDLSPRHDESSTTTSRDIENCVANISDQSSQWTHTKSREIEECVADICEQSFQRSNTKSREIEEFADISGETQSSGAYDMYKDIPQRMPNIVNKSMSSHSFRESSSDPAKNVNSMQSPFFSRKVRQEQQERINRVLQTMALSSTPPRSLMKASVPVPYSVDRKCNSLPETNFTKSSTASDPFSISDSAESFEEMLADFDEILDGAECDTSASNPYISNDESDEGNHPYPTDIVQSSLALNGKDRINFLTAQASDLVSIGEFEEALGIMWVTLKIQQSAYGDTHPEVASVHHNIGIIHAKCAENATSASKATESNTFAMKEFRIAARVARQTKGKLHPNVAVSLARIGLIQIQVGMYTEAVVTFQECLRIRQMAFGKKHSLVGNIHNNLGVAYLSLGSFRKGLEAFESACLNQKRTIRKLAGGDIDKIYARERELADTLCNIGSVCLDWAEKKGLNSEKKSKLAKYAIVVFDEAIEIRSRSLGNSNGLVEEARQLKNEAERQMENSSNRPTSPDISVLQSAIPVSRKSEHESLIQKNRTESLEHQSAIGDEESCVISQGKNGGCIALPCDACSIPFDESPAFHAIQAKDYVQMQRIESVAWGDPSTYNESRSKNSSGTTLYVSSNENSSNWVSFECSGGNCEMVREEGSITPVSQFQCSNAGETQCAGRGVSESGEIEGSINESGRQSSSVSAIVASRTQSQSHSQHQEDKSLRDRSLFISKPPSFDERRCGKESPFSPFGAPSFPVSKVNMDPTKSEISNNADKSITMRTQQDQNQFNSPRGILRNGRSYQNQSKRSQLNIKGEDSLYDTTTSDMSMGAEGAEMDISKIEKSRDSLDMSGDGLVTPSGHKDGIRRNSKIGKDIMLGNLGKYKVEIHELAAQYLKNEDLERSLELFEVLLVYFKGEHGELHHTVGSCLHNIGVVLLRSQDYERALLSFEQAVRVRKGSMGRDHADVAVSLVKVGITQLLLRTFDEALCSFRDALSIRRHALGHLHPSTARIYNNIGCVHVEFKELRQARRAFESALDVQRSTLCDEPDNEQLLFGTATTLCNLGYLYSSRGAHEKACLVLKEAAGFQQRVFGPLHSTVLSILDSLADSYGKSGDNLNALQTYKTIVAGLEGDERIGQVLSSRKKRAIAIVFYKMSRIFKKQNDHESALRFLRNSVSYVKELGAPQLLDKVEDEMNQVKQQLHKSTFDWV